MVPARPFHPLRPAPHAQAKETFEKLEAHLKEKGMLPDEYFLYDMDLRTKVKELPDFDSAFPGKKRKIRCQGSSPGSSALP